MNSFSGNSDFKIDILIFNLISSCLHYLAPKSQDALWSNWEHIHYISIGDIWGFKIITTVFNTENCWAMVALLPHLNEDHTEFYISFSAQSLPLLILTTNSIRKVHQLPHFLAMQWNFHLPFFKPTMKKKNSTAHTLNCPEKPQLQGWSWESLTQFEPALLIQQALPNTVGIGHVWLVGKGLEIRLWLRRKSVLSG